MKMSEKRNNEELKSAAGGGFEEYGDADWLISCHSCKAQFTIHGFQQVIYCPE